MQLAILLICLSPIWTNPQDTTEMMEIQFSGSYQTGRAPCEWLPDGSRRWAVTAGFNVDTVLKGNLKVTYIEIAPDGNDSNEVQLQEGMLYKVSIRMSGERFKALELDDDETIMLYQDPILKREITSIEKK